MKNKFACLVGVLIAGTALAAPVELIEADVLSRFRPVEKWSVAGAVVAVEGRKALTSTPPDDAGPKILLNTHGKEPAPYLFTQEEYADVSLRLDFMIPRHSNSGVYFMGRYEVQIKDSFGKDPVSFGDLGGIYQRWNDAAPTPDERGFEGVPPRVNAAKAPGEWQRLDVVFRAPRFDNDGVKVENARFVSVRVNGRLVQENVEVTGPTRAHPLRGEAARGPISIQGDHGPIAIRGFKVEVLEPSPTE